MSKRRDVILAVKALVQAALPLAKIAGFDQDTAKPKRLDPAGTVIGHPGDAGEPEVDLSPLTYHYEHAIVLELAAPSGGGNQDEALDEMMGAIGTLIAADRYLGGLCTWLEAGTPDVDDRAADGADGIRWASLPIIASYTTQDPLN